MTIPAPLVADYRVATSRDIRMWSFGELRAPRPTGATAHDNVVGTLHDQRIFGPIRDFRCACGKYAGERHKNMVCDRCGVKIASSAVRGSRFGHIEFEAPIAHPYAPERELQCFPVLPILFIESPGGRQLPALYDQLIEAVAHPDTGHILQAIASILDDILPATVTAHEWRLPAARILARGLALESND